MLHFKRTQRSVLIEKIGDAANVAVGSLLFGQALGGNSRSGWFALVGIVTWIVLIGLSMWLARRK